jgi:hypothetical protein
MADVTCPLSFEDCSALRTDEALPPELRAVLDDPAGTVELSDSYEVQLTEVEARALLTWAKCHEIRHLESDLRQELAGFERRKRESGQKP